MTAEMIAHITSRCNWNHTLYMLNF